MMREKLPQRRLAHVTDFVHRLPGASPQEMTATIGYFEDGRAAEIFIDPPKLSNDAANLARDVALVISIALQHGVLVEEMRAAVGRAEDGTPHSIAGSALDLLSIHSRAPWLEAPELVTHKQNQKRRDVARMEAAE